MPDTARAFDVETIGSVLRVSVRKEFDFGVLAQDWAHALTVTCNAAYTEVRFDLSRCGLVSSTFFAGLVQIHQHYTAQGVERVVLEKPDPRLVKNLKVLRLDSLFIIEPRAV